MKLPSLLIFFILMYSNCCALFAEDLNDPDIMSENDFTTIRGLIKPTTSAVLSSEISAQIEKLAFSNGDAFNKGDILVQFDCAYYLAQISAAKAELEARKLNLENQQQLLALKANSKLQVDLAAIEVKKAKADVTAKNISVGRCVIKAPFNGRVIETLVNQYESVAKDQELISILDDANLEIEAIVPSNWLSWIKPGIIFQFNVDETGNSYKAKILQVGAVVDPVSQTIPIKGTFEKTVDVLSGMSGTASFKSPVE